MYWSKKPPKSPISGPSLWYWFWQKGEEEPVIMELWAKRDVKRFKGYWWHEPQPCPPKNPFIDS